LESPKEGKPQTALPVSPLDQAEKKTEVVPPPQERTAASENLVQAREREKRLDEKKTGGKHEVQQDRGGQKPPGIELLALSRQPPAVATNQRPQQSTPIYPVRPTDRNPPPARHTQPLNPQENKPGVTGWFKSLADGF